MTAVPWRRVCLGVDVKRLWHGDRADAGDADRPSRVRRRLAAGAQVRRRALRCAQRRRRRAARSRVPARISPAPTPRSAPRWRRSALAGSCSTARWSRSTASRHRSAGSSSASGSRAPSAELVAAYPVVYCVFDLLEIDGEDLTDRPLVERRARLTQAIRPSAALQLTEAWRGDSAAAVRRGVPVGLGGTDRQARRRAVRRRAARRTG